MVNSDQRGIFKNDFWNNHKQTVRGKNGLRNHPEGTFLRNNISTRTIMRIENGKQGPSLIYAMRLASYFSCNVEQLFGYSQDNETPEKDVKIHEW